MNKRQVAPLSRSDAAQLIRSSKGRFLNVVFVKRTTGEERRMVCRLGVRKHLKGGTRPYNPTEHGLITVFGMGTLEYRMIPVEGLLRIKVNGKWKEVRQ